MYKWHEDGRELIIDLYYSNYSNYSTRLRFTICFSFSTAAVRLGKPSLALTLRFISISPKTQTHAVPALLPCIWHSGLQSCALLNPLALQRAIVLTALLQRWGIQMNLDYIMTPTSLSWLPSFVGYLGDGWISPAWCIVSGWLSTWACSALKGHRSSMCFAMLHEGWREMQICGDHCYKGKAGIRFRIGVHLRRRGKIKNNCALWRTQ